MMSLKTYITINDVISEKTIDLSYPIKNLAPARWLQL